LERDRLEGTLFGPRVALDEFIWRSENYLEFNQEELNLFQDSAASLQGRVRVIAVAGIAVVPTLKSDPHDSSGGRGNQLNLSQTP
jgi:hypothetical protein